MNKVCLVGRLTKDAEIRVTNSGLSVASFTVAINRTYKNKNGEYDTDFINCVAYKNNAEYLGKYATKGSQVGIDGRIQIRSYDAEDGTKRYVTEVIADNIELMGSKKEDKPVEIDPFETFGDVAVEVSDNVLNTELSSEDLPF